MCRWRCGWRWSGRQLQAMYPGDDARMNRHGAQCGARVSAAQFRDQKPASLPAPPESMTFEPMTIDVEPEPVKLRAAADG